MTALHTNETLLDFFKNNPKLKDAHIDNNLVGFRLNQKRDSTLYWFKVFSNENEKGDVFFDHSYNQNNGRTCKSYFTNINGNRKALEACGYFTNTNNN